MVSLQKRPASLVHDMQAFPRVHGANFGVFQGRVGLARQARLAISLSHTETPILLLDG